MRRVTWVTTLEGESPMFGQVVEGQTAELDDERAQLALEAGLATLPGMEPETDAPRRRKGAQ